MKRLAIVLLIIAAICPLLAACDNGTNPPGKDPNEPDDFWTDGFTRDQTTASEMVNDLIGGVMETLRQAGETDSRIISSNIRLNIDYNNDKSYLLIKSNYFANNPQDTAAMFEFRDAENDELQLGAYLYQKNGFTNLYINLEENKIKIPIKGYNLSDNFPLQMRFSPDAKTLVSMGFLTFMSVKGNIDYEYKVANNMCERHFRFYVDVPKSLASFVNMDASWRDTMGVSGQEIDLLLRNILGICSADVQSGNIPDTTIKVEFNTIGGDPDSFGEGKISKLKMDVAAKSMQTGDTVFGKDFSIKINAETLLVSNTSVKGIPAENTFGDYVDYSNRKFRIYATVKEDGGGEEADVTADFIYDAANADQTCFTVSVVGKTSGQELCSICYRDKYIYLNWLDGGQKKNIKWAFDFNCFLLMLSDEIGSSPNLSFISVLSQLMANLRLYGGQVSYRFEPRLYNEIMGISEDKLLYILSECCSDSDISETLAQAGVSVADFFKSFTLSLGNTDKFIEQISEITYPDEVNQLSK